MHKIRYADNNTLPIITGVNRGSKKSVEAHFFEYAVHTFRYPPWPLGVKQQYR